MAASARRKLPGFSQAFGSQQIYKDTSGSLSALLASMAANGGLQKQPLMEPRQPFMQPKQVLGGFAHDAIDSQGQFGDAIGRTPGSLGGMASGFSPLQDGFNIPNMGMERMPKVNNPMAGFGANGQINAAQGSMGQPSQAPMQRVSPGVYRNAAGKLVRSATGGSGIGAGAFKQLPGRTPGGMGGMASGFSPMGSARGPKVSKIMR